MSELIKFDPSKDYQWEASDKFALTGLQLELINNVSASIINTNITPAQMYLGIFEIYKMAGEIIKSAVENGIIQEKIIA